MDLGLNGKRALVLGSSGGLGLGIAENLISEGVDIAICSRNNQTLKTITNKLESKSNGKVNGYKLDLTDKASVSKFINLAKQDFDGFDIVVNNGGGPPPGAMNDIEPETFSKHFRPMVLSQIEITSAFIPGMRKMNWGRILIISSSGTTQPIPGLGVSNTLRSSLLGWAKTLSTEIAKDGVTVNTIQPGRIHTERVNQIDAAAAKRTGKSLEQIVKASRDTIPTGRYGSIKEFSDVATFILSNCASYLTGSLIRVDGGYIKSI